MLDQVSHRFSREETGDCWSEIITGRMPLYSADPRVGLT